MFEKVNPSHPDKIADRIAGAIVDMAYTKAQNPRIAVEVLIGHGNCHIITESSVKIETGGIRRAVYRIAGTDDIAVNIEENPQDEHLAKNQETEIRCGDNGIFSGTWTNYWENKFSGIVRNIYMRWPSDGKFITTYDTDRTRIICCQSNAKADEVKAVFVHQYPETDPDIIVNPLGDWTGGINVDTGATNRKLGSDMGRAVTGGGLHGKDLSKADVSVNIYAYLLAQETARNCLAACAIGDTKLDFVDALSGKLIETASFAEIVEAARRYVNKLGGFEKLAEWGLI